MSAKSTKKAKRAPAGEMRAHYDFRKAKRGRFRELAGAHVVVVSDDVWKHFGSDAAVVAALRGLVANAKRAKARKRSSRRAA